MSCAPASPSGSQAASNRSRLLVPYEEGATLAALYALGAPIEAREDREDGVLIRARLPQRELRRYAPFLVAEPAQPSASAL